MKKSTLFLTGMAALLLSFGLILTGCPTDSDNTSGNDDDIKAPPETVTNETAKEYFTGLFDAFPEEEKDGFFLALIEIMSGLDGDISHELQAALGDLPDDPSGLPDEFWTVIVKHWDKIKGPLGKAVDEMNKANNPPNKEDPGTPGGKSDLPESLTPTKAEAYFVDWYRNATDVGEKWMILFLISGIAEEIGDKDLQAKIDKMYTVPGGLTELNLSPAFWKAVSDNWTEIKAGIEDMPVPGETKA
jgi:hypothetical protein